MTATRMTIVFEFDEIDPSDLDQVLADLRSFGQAKVTDCEDIEAMTEYNIFRRGALDSIRTNMRISA